jgi:hypothetical protein
MENSTNNMNLKISIGGLSTQIVKFQYLNKEAKILKNKKARTKTSPKCVQAQKILGKLCYAKKLRTLKMPMVEDKNYGFPHRSPQKIRAQQAKKTRKTKLPKTQ